MDPKIFAIPVEYRGEKYKAEVRTVMPNGLDNIDHEIWINAQYAFTISLDEDECDDLCWKSKEPGVDPEFVSVVGEAIGRHYL